MFHVKKSRRSGEVIIVFDVMGFLHKFGRSSIELILGGRYHLYLQEFESFLQALIAAGATLQFFCDGQLQSEKSDEWCRRRDTEFHQKYVYIDEDRPDYELSKRFGCKSITKSFFKLIEDKGYGQIVKSTQVECDAAIAKYAVSKDALAVVANDSDFVIFEGNYQWWDAASISFNEMQVHCFDRNLIRNEFRFTNEMVRKF